MKRSIPFYALLCILALLPFKAIAQEVYHTSPLQLQTANIYSTSPLEETVDVFNPSVISDITHCALEVSCLIPFALKELCQVDAKVAASTQLCHLQGEIMKSGNDGSSFTVMGGGISRRFHRFGIGFEYRALIHKQMNTEAYSSSFSRFGLHVDLSEEWKVAMAVNNIEGRRIRYKECDVDIPSFATIGLRWKHSMLVVQAEVEKNWKREAMYKVAASVVTRSAVFGSVGIIIRDDIASPSAGVGVSLEHFTINAGMSYHNKLGVSSGASIALVNIW